MSRQSKNARNIARRKEFTKIRQGGGAGPDKTQPRHEKRNAWWQKFGSYSSFIKGGKKPRREDEAQPEPTVAA